MQDVDPAHLESVYEHMYAPIDFTHTLQCGRRLHHSRTVLVEGRSLPQKTGVKGSAEDPSRQLHSSDA